jgi:nucleoside-diphosphate-sugar epimerase
MVMARVVVTGGTGFIGSNLSLRLESEGYKVKICDNLSRGLSPLLKEKELDIARVDLLDFEGLLKEFREAEYVFHNAAIRSIPLSIEEPVRTSKVNILGTLNVLEAARKSGVKRVILASSSSVYGNNPLPFKESMQPKPLSLYASAKVANEHHARLYHELYGVETICLRYFNVFGYGQDGTYKFSPVIPRFIHAMLYGKRPVILGDGKHSRDFTFIENVVEANLLAMKADKNAAGRVFNVAQGEEHSLNEVMHMLNGLLGTEIEPTYADSRKGDLKHTSADLSLSGEVLGYKPRASFEDGLKATVEWYKKKK